MTTSALHFLDPESPELERAWQTIATRYGNTTCEHPDSGEVWQYMGTARGAGEQAWRHEFRHRDLWLPLSGPGPFTVGVNSGRVYTRIDATKGWQP